jgi:hypothetical protein
LSIRPTVCVSRWWAGRDSLREQKKPEARKMLENAAESHQSAARFVGTLLTCKTHCLKKDTTAELLKLLHKPLTLATTKKLTCKCFDRLNNQRWLFKDLLQTKTYNQKTRWL